METWIIRAVDWGNIQRSPTFQAIFNYFFSGTRLLPKSIVFDSAGTHVDDITRDLTPATKKLDIIDAGIEYGVIKGENKVLADEFLSKWLGKDEAHIPDGEKQEITDLYSEIKTNVHLQQMGFRNKALLEAGIPEEYLPRMRIPFRHHENLKLILPLEESIVLDVDEFYQSFLDRQPITEIYADLVGIKPLNDVLDGGIETARKQVDYFLNTREKAIEKIIELLSRQ